MKEEFIARVKRAEFIIWKLKERRDGTISREAAKQLESLLRTAQRNSALGHEVAAMEQLEWAS